MKKNNILVLRQFFRKILTFSHRFTMPDEFIQHFIEVRYHTLFTLVKVSKTEVLQIDSYSIVAPDA